MRVSKVLRCKLVFIRLGRASADSVRRPAIAEAFGMNIASTWRISFCLRTAMPPYRASRIFCTLAPLGDLPFICLDRFSIKIVSQYQWRTAAYRVESLLSL